MDVKNVLLHRDPKEIVYMELSPGFAYNIGDNKVCCLKKALYSLKQPSSAWFERFTQAMTKIEYSKAKETTPYL
ncbi:hypothetical protein NZD89_29245 (plasmid) [Alicyclobacillus fastidiosus]|uniref:Reverse transcriptase Ty1/copia-type domain-containing protein n=2 Tax=Alicyclobacillus fastidiosus TaxID=392011 RepID=A0ABY6ZSF2_9BACL|nr:hypothetical protein NZD89_29245 [Alicyclobacillus fastidiosus]